ncbi:hypothetical protein KM043_010898 [Ampulex compressa]|nr:hypothetical protein KM043_010898 [Ampulex compressa]
MPIVAKAGSGEGELPAARELFTALESAARPSARGGYGEGVKLHLARAVLRIVGLEWWNYRGRDGQEAWEMEPWTPEEKIPMHTPARC